MRSHFSERKNRPAENSALSPVDNSSRVVLMETRRDGGREFGMASDPTDERSEVTDPERTEVLAAVVIALSFVAATRFPFVRTGPVETDEWQFVSQMDESWFPAHHTLFQTIGRAIGMFVGGHYQGLVVLDMIVSAVALVSVWWWLRALVRPSTAAACTLVVGVAPLFWSLGEMAGNYTMIPLVSSFLLGVAYRGWRAPKAWHPYASAVVLACGTGYREDIGTYLLPILGVILWSHRWKRAIWALALFTLLNLAWLLPMLHEVGGWDAYRKQSAEFAYTAGFKNSVWNLGLVDAPARYAVKMALAFLWTLGPGLIFLPRGLVRLVRLPDGKKLAGLLVLSVAPPLGSHLLVHFGVAGYSFHYLSFMVALLAIGVGRLSIPSLPARSDQAVLRFSLLAAMLAGLFLFYPADVDRPGWRGDFDLAIARYTRVGLRSDLAHRAPSSWRTSNSTAMPGPRAN
jgi:Dolichyl-phosphate-mannose-protein mannosyltransferase